MMQKMQTRNSTAMQEQRMQRITCDVPTVPQMNGLQQFKYHILQLQLQKIGLKRSSRLDNTIFQDKQLRIVLLIQHLPMKSKAFVQKPFGRIEAAKHLTIQINQDSQPSTIHPPSAKNDLPQIIKHQIDEIKSRIDHSEKILEQSRRQAGQTKKVVQSDYISLHFNYSSAKSYQPILHLDRLEERQSQYSLQNEESQGTIQLPIHLQPSTHERNSLSTRNTTGNKPPFKSNLPKELAPQTSLSKTSWNTDTVFSLNENTNSLEKLNPSKVNKATTPKSNQKVGFYREQYSKEKIISASKKRILTETSGYLRIDTQSSKQRNTDRSKSKNKQQLQAQKPTQKLIIKLNRPNDGKVSGKQQYHARPRYHIKMPAAKNNYQHKTDHSHPAKVQPSRNQWEQLKQNLRKYEFVRKYLNESDLYEIYEHLKKNHINQQKWPLFVVDEAYKKMNAHKAY